MSETKEEMDEPGVLTAAYRTVTPGYASHSNSEMTAIGLGYALGLVILLAPLLPFVIMVWVFSKAIGHIAPSQQTPREEL